MQQRPSPTALLEALADFLADDVQPAVASDPALRFRVLIAANLVRQLAAEQRGLAPAREAEHRSLAALLGHPPPAAASSEERAAAIAALDAELAAAIRAGRVDPALARRHLMDTLGDHLRRTDPAFDLRLDLEPPESAQ